MRAQARACVNSCKMSRCRASVCARASPALVTALAAGAVSSRRACCMPWLHAPAHRVVDVGEPLQKRLDLFTPRRHKLQRAGLAQRPERRGARHARRRGGSPGRYRHRAAPQACLPLRRRLWLRRGSRACRPGRAAAPSFEKAASLESTSPSSLRACSARGRQAAASDEPQSPTPNAQRTSLRSTSHKPPCPPGATPAMPPPANMGAAGRERASLARDAHDACVVQRTVYTGGLGLRLRSGHGASRRVGAASRRFT